MTRSAQVLLRPSSGAAIDWSRKPTVAWMCVVDDRPGGEVGVVVFRPQCSSHNLRLAVGAGTRTRLARTARRGQGEARPDRRGPSISGGPAILSWWDSSARAVTLSAQSKTDRPIALRGAPVLLRMSTLFLRTLREDPADAEVPSHRLLVRAGYVRRAAPGIYTWLPLGYQVLRNVERDRARGDECAGRPGGALPRAAAPRTV